jgi:hypothetical protein
MNLTVGTSVQRAGHWGRRGEEVKRTTVKVRKDDERREE